MSKPTTTSPPGEASAEKPPAAASAVPVADDAKGHLKDTEEVPTNPLAGYSSTALNGFAGLCAGCSVAVIIFGKIVLANPDFFYTGALTAGQTMAFFMGFVVLAWGVAATAVPKFWTDTEILSVDAKSAVGTACEFTILLFLFFFCDRTTFFKRDGKLYNQWEFWGLWTALTIAALFTLRRAKAPKAKAAPKEEAPKPVEGAAAGAAGETDAAAAAAATVAVPEPAAPEAEPEEPSEFHVGWLQRDQTEEWKGWMQIMFLWYHYFEAKPVYNAIRLYIAAYVWMTGFGNFSYYYIRRDFSLARFCQMQWRLNFLVIWVCLLLRNEYMLYYINMLHTTFTVMIYAGLGIASHMQFTVPGAWAKFVIITGLTLVLWDVPGVFDYVWAPFTWLVQYHDPYNPKRPIMHEWQFRSHLDHLIWIVGMFTAFFHPNVDAIFVKLDAMPTQKGRAIKGAIVAVCLAIMWVYVDQVFSLPKKQYNALHPYTSFIPITVYILLRNLYSVLRRWHMHLFEYCGKITLETYIGQFHIWMLTTGVNGAPKKLLRLVPGPALLNFAVTSALLMWVSLRLFETTVALKAWVLPSKTSDFHLKRNIVAIAVVMAAAYVWGIILTAVIDHGQ